LPECCIPVERLCPIQKRVLIDEACAGTINVYSAGSPAMMLVDLNSGRPKAGAYVLGVSEPLHAGSCVPCHCSVVNISLDCQHTRDSIEICEDWVHGYTEKEN
jgi:hypothetical protein